VKEANWQDCLDNQSARIVKPDIKIANSLIETADERISLIKSVNEKTAILSLKIIISLF